MEEELVRVGSQQSISLRKLLLLILRSRIRAQSLFFS